MMELVMAMAKAMSTDEIVNEMDKWLHAYKENPCDKAKSKLHFAAMLFTLHNTAEKMSMVEAVKMVEDMKRQHDLFNVKTKSN